MSDALEEADAHRMEALARLDALRGHTLADRMADLGLTPAAHG